MSQLVYGSQPINGQLVPELTGTQIFPSQAFVPYYQGRGSYTPTMPPPVQFNGYSADPWTTGLAGGAAQDAAADPFNPAVSPVIWAIVFLAIGLLGLRYIHWRG